MNNDGLESSLKKDLDNLMQLPGRDPQVVARGKAAFLRQAVSLKANQSQSGWIKNLFPTI